MPTFGSQHWFRDLDGQVIDCFHGNKVSMLGGRWSIQAYGVGGRRASSADWISMIVPKVCMGDSSSLSEMETASLGSNLCMCQKALSLLTQVLFSSTIVISAFIALTPFGGAVIPGAGLSVHKDWVVEAPGTRGSLPEAPPGQDWF